MKIYFQIGELGGQSPLQFLRRLGYSPLPNRQGGQSSFVRRLRGDFYPRFHIYLNQVDEKHYFNLHLDQKKASYQGQSAHSGEYDGPLVVEEAKRLKLALTKRGDESSNQKSDSDSIADLSAKNKQNSWLKRFGL